LGTGSFEQKRIISAVKRVKFVTNGMSHIILIIIIIIILVACNFLNVHASKEDKTSVKYSF
jgi:hypothetical protein